MTHSYIKSKLKAFWLDHGILFVWCCQISHGWTLSPPDHSANHQPGDAQNTRNTHQFSTTVKWSWLTSVAPQNILEGWIFTLDASQLISQQEISSKLHSVCVQFHLKDSSGAGWLSTSWLVPWRVPVPNLRQNLPNGVPQWSWQAYPWRRSDNGFRLRAESLLLVRSQWRLWIWWRSDGLCALKALTSDKQKGID